MSVNHTSIPTTGRWLTAEEAAKDPAVQAFRQGGPRALKRELKARGEAVNTDNLCGSAAFSLLLWTVGGVLLGGILYGIGYMDALTAAVLIPSMPAVMVPVSLFFYWLEERL